MNLKIQKPPFFKTPNLKKNKLYRISKKHLSFTLVVISLIYSFHTIRQSIRKSAGCYLKVKCPIKVVNDLSPGHHPGLVP